MTADRERVDTAVFDVDGTLVDTNYQHAPSWYRAFRSFDIVLPIWRLRRAIGMGGDNLVARIAVRTGGFSTDELRDAGATPSKSCGRTSTRRRSASGGDRRPVLLRTAAGMGRSWA